MKNNKFGKHGYLQLFAAAPSVRSEVDPYDRIEEIEERKAELYKKTDESKDVKELAEIREELNILNSELRDLNKKIREEQRGAASGTGITNAQAIAGFYGIGGNGQAGGQLRSVASFQMGRGYVPPVEDGAQIIRSGQLLSDLKPNKDGLSLGRYMRGAITGDWTDSEKEQAEFRSLTTATGGIMIPEVLSMQVIDIARNQSILFQSGVPMIPMTSNNMTISRVKTDPVFGFKGEGEAVTEGTMEFEGVQLKSKTAYGLISVSIEALKSSQNLETVLRTAMAESMARTIDLKCLFGVEANDEPKGVLTYTDINTQAETADLANYSPFVKAIGKVRAANGEPTAWALNATTDEQLNLLVNSHGDPMQIPEVVKNLQRMVSNQLPANGGTGTDESTSMVFDPNAMLIGLQSPLMVEVSKEAGDAFKKGLVYLRVYAMLDIAVLRPKRICKITGLK